MYICQRKSQVLKDNVWKFAGSSSVRDRHVIFTLKFAILILRKQECLMEHTCHLCNCLSRPAQEALQTDA